MVAYTFYEMDQRVRRYAETLVKAGWQVDAYALAQSGQPRVETVAGVKVYRIQSRQKNEKGKLTYLLRLVLFLLRSTLRLGLRHLFRPYRLVHVHSVPDFEVFAAIIPRLLGAKVILDIHDSVPELFTSKFRAGRDSLLFKALVLTEKISTSFAHHTIIANHIWHERIAARTGQGRKCSVIMNYPDTTIFFPRARTRADGKFVLIYPGSLSRHQGLDTAILAVALLRETIPEIEFHIYGTGTDERHFRFLSEELGLQPQVQFKGLVPMSSVAQAMAQADLGVEPKIRNPFSDEAFSTKIFEFMLLGVPVIASDTTVHKYYFEDSLLRFFHAGDVTDLADAVRQLYHNPELRRRYRERGLAYVKDYTWEKRGGAYLSLVDNLTARGPLSGDLMPANRHGR
jgi:glycosyltransferase involved in cell wall biosynthesis